MSYALSEGPVYKPSLWQKVKGMIEELYYILRHPNDPYFVTREKINTETRTLEIQEYAMLDRNTRKFHWFQTVGCNRNTVFPLWGAALTVFVFRKRYKDSGWTYSTVPLSDAAFTHYVQTGTRLRGIENYLEINTNNPTPN